MATGPASAPPRADQSGREAAAAALGVAFRHLFRTLSRIRGRDTHLAGTELSHAQFELLTELFERGPLPAGELAAAARLSPGTVTQMLDALAESGHVERDRSETDRRVVVTRLTALGAGRLEAKRALWQSRWQEALAGFTPRELQAATRVLQRLGEMFAQEAPAVAGEQPLEGPAKPVPNGRNPA